MLPRGSPAASKCHHHRSRSKERQMLSPSIRRGGLRSIVKVHLDAASVINSGLLRKTNNISLSGLLTFTGDSRMFHSSMHKHTVLGAVKQPLSKLYEFCISNT